MVSIFGDKAETPEEFLLPGEKVVNKYKVGSYEVLTTNDNTYFYRKFPLLLERIPYREITNVEYITNIHWVEIEKAIVYLNIVFLLYLNHNGVLIANDLIKSLVPSVTDTLPAEISVITIASLLTVGFFNSILNFLKSFKGRCIISRRFNPQLSLYSGMTGDLKSLIKDIEVKIDQISERANVAKLGENSLGREAQIKREEIEGLDKLAPKKTVFVSVNSTKQMHLISRMLETVVGKGMGGVYLAFTKPYDEIAAALITSGVPQEDIYFIDCISMMAGKVNEGKKERVTYVENASSLEEISMHLDKSLMEVKAKDRFVLLDSLSSFLIYNNDKSVKEFIHYFINKSRIDNLLCVIVNMEGEEANRLLKGFTPMSDVKIEFK
jgi:hypothetical protein